MFVISKQSIAGAFLFLCPSLAAGSQGVARARLRKIVGHIQPIAQQVAPAAVAATADFLKNPDFARIVRQKWGDHISAYRQTIRTMLENEERYKKKYFGSFHAQKGENRLVGRLLRNAHEWTTGESLRPDFEYLRYWEYGSDFENVNAYLNSFEVNTDSKIKWVYEGGRGKLSFSDLRPSVGAVLLAVNPYLFSNFTEHSECTFEHFVQGSAGGDYEGNLVLLEKLFDRYGWDKKYIPELLAIQDQFRTRTGDIIQIFIPKGSIEKYAYISRAAGHTIQLPVKKTLELMQNNIGAVTNAQELQVRLFFAKSGPLLQPAKGAKMFRFTTLSPERLQEYNDCIDEVFKKMVNGQRRSPMIYQKQSPLSFGAEQEVIGALKTLATPRSIIEAVRYPDAVSLIRKLAAQGYDVDEKDRNGITALMIASSRGDVDVVRCLLEPHGGIKRADIGAVYLWNGKTALAFAASVGALSVVQYLVAQGADITKYGASAMTFAAGYGHLDVVKYLISCGVDINKIDRNNQTALSRACKGFDYTEDVTTNQTWFQPTEGDRLAVVKWLVAQGAYIGDVFLSEVRGNEIAEFLKGKGVSEKVRPIKNLLFGYPASSLEGKAKNYGIDLSPEEMAWHKAREREVDV